MYHFYGNNPTITAENKVSTLLRPMREKTTRESYYSDSYLIVDPNNWRCCVGDCSCKVTNVKMTTKKSGKTEFETFFKHLKNYHPYHLSGDDFMKLQKNEKGNDNSCVASPNSEI